MININFKISEFNISGKSIPEDIADKILKWHITPMIPVRVEIGTTVWASQSSGYRSTYWEKSRGRSGNSQHTFKGKGAVDWTCYNFTINKDVLLELIIKYTNYSRIAVYDNFIHCDYKVTSSGKRELYSSNSNSKWKFDKYI